MHIFRSRRPSWRALDRAGGASITGTLRVLHRLRNRLRPATRARVAALALGIVAAIGAPVVAVQLTGSTAHHRTSAMGTVADTVPSNTADNTPDTTPTTIYHYTCQQWLGTHSFDVSADVTVARSGSFAQITQVSNEQAFLSGETLGVSLSNVTTNYTISPDGTSVTLDGNALWNF